MIFFSPRYIKQAKHLRHAAKKLLNYRRDIWSTEQVASFTSAIYDLSQGMKNRDRTAVTQSGERLEELAGKFAPPLPLAGLRENIEVFLVAIVIAVGVRTYFLQPFKIPTGSMQPTLFGIVGTPTDIPLPSFSQRVWDMVVKGRTWLDLKAKRTEEITSLNERSIANFFTFTDIHTVDEAGVPATYTLFAPRDPLERTFHLKPGRIYQEGEPIVHGYVDTGDQVFVDKASYHFTTPHRGEVFVFRTTDIHGIQRFIPPGMGSQYYIKRLAGLPKDTLRIDPPNLYINGALAQEPMIQRVMAAKNGYQGYSNAPAFGKSFPLLGSPTSTFAVPTKTYFALGDNSYHSSDSRNWGIVPEQNVTGRGLFVYWPFTSRWGWIR